MGGAAGLDASFSFAFWSSAKYPFFGAAGAGAGAADAGLTAGGAGFDCADIALVAGMGFLTAGLDGFADPGAAVPR